MIVTRDTYRAQEQRYRLRRRQYFTPSRFTLTQYATEPNRRIMQLLEHTDWRHRQARTRAHRQLIAAAFRREVERIHRDAGCWACEGSGWRNVKGDTHAGYGFCPCPAGRDRAREQRRIEAERQLAERLDPPPF